MKKICLFSMTIFIMTALAFGVETVLQNGLDERLNEFTNATRGIEFGFACKIKEPGYVFNAVKGKYVMGRSAGRTWRRSGRSMRSITNRPGWRP